MHLILFLGKEAKLKTLALTPGPLPQERERDVSHRK
jgi:hypothetical protein